MSKRVANTKMTTARNGRVRLGWRRVQQLNMLTKAQEQLSLQEMTESVKEQLKTIKTFIKKALPRKREMRRHQGR